MRTLILDGNFQPIRIVSWQRAIVLMILERGHVVEYYNKKIRSTHQSFQVPKVFQVKGVAKKRFFRLRPTRHNIFKRDNNTCAYCGLKFMQKDLTVEHIIPRSQGGNNSWHNLITACATCNNKKGANTPEQAKMPLLFKPTVPKWTPKMVLDIKKSELEIFRDYILY